VTRSLRRLAAAALVGAGGVAALWWWALPASLPAADPSRCADRGDAELAELRLTGGGEAIDRHLARLEADAAGGAQPALLRRIAETRLERVLQRAQRKGLRVGEPVWADLPEPVRADVAAGLAALRAARERGDEHSESFRIEAGLLAQQIQGLASALRLNAQVDAALRRALELDPANARAHVALACRSLFAPRLLGHDPRRALDHLAAAVHALQRDERPLVFAAFAHHLLGDAGATLACLEQALARNPDNAYAREVLRRLRAGEARAFERDLP
jgi:hypothetical protein